MKHLGLISVKPQDCCGSCMKSPQSDFSPTLPDQWSPNSAVSASSQFQLSPIGNGPPTSLQSPMFDFLPTRSDQWSPNLAVISVSSQCQLNSNTMSANPQIKSACCAGSYEPTAGRKSFDFLEASLLASAKANSTNQSTMEQNQAEPSLRLIHSVASEGAISADDCDPEETNKLLLAIFSSPTNGLAFSQPIISTGVNSATRSVIRKRASVDQMRLPIKRAARANEVPGNLIEAEVAKMAAACGPSRLSYPKGTIPESNRNTLRLACHTICLGSYRATALSVEISENGLKMSLSAATECGPIYEDSSRIAEGVVDVEIRRSDLDSVSYCFCPRRRVMFLQPTPFGVAALRAHARVSSLCFDASDDAPELKLVTLMLTELPPDHLYVLLGLCRTLSDKAKFYDNKTFRAEAVPYSQATAILAKLIPGYSDDPPSQPIAKPALSASRPAKKANENSAALPKKARTSAKPRQSGVVKVPEEDQLLSSPINQSLSLLHHSAPRPASALVTQDGSLPARDDSVRDKRIEDSIAAVLEAGTASDRPPEQDDSLYDIISEFFYIEHIGPDGAVVSPGGYHDNVVDSASDAALSNGLSAGDASESEVAPGIYYHYDDTGVSAQENALEAVGGLPLHHAPGAIGGQALAVVAAASSYPYEEVRPAKRLSGKKLFSYPSLGTDQVTVCEGDRATLNEGQELNDNIIDFWLRYVLEEHLSADLRERVHLFSSHFWSRLINQGKWATGAERDKLWQTDKSLFPKTFDFRYPIAQHYAVRNWTRRWDLFAKDFVLIPINSGRHWVLAIIAYPSLLGQQPVQRQPSRKSAPSTSRDLDEQEEGFRPQPTIFIFDSFLGALSHSVDFGILRNYLTVEWCLRKGTAAHFDQSNLDERCPRVPKQPNGFDCGIYLLQYAEEFFKRYSECFVTTKFGPDLTHWFKPSDLSDKRACIKTLIDTLSST